MRPSTDVRNLVVSFDETLSLKTHVTQLVGRCYGWLRRIRSCGRALTQSAAITLVNSFIVARLQPFVGWMWPATCTGTALAQALFNGVWLGAVLYHRTLRSCRFNPSAVFTAVSCSRHSVRRAHPSGTRQACVCRCSPSCMEQSP